MESKLTTSESRLQSSLDEKKQLPSQIKVLLAEVENAKTDLGKQKKVAEGYMKKFQNEKDLKDKMKIDVDQKCDEIKDLRKELDSYSELLSA